MGYAIQIKQQAKKKLESLPKIVRLRITEKIDLLRCNPDDQNLDVKPLVGEPYYRLRVGDWRVIFDRQEIVKIITIEKIKSRGDIYK